MQRHKDFWEITKDSLDKSIKEFKIDPSLKGELLELYKKLSIFPEVNEVLKQLRKKNIKLAILSNGTPNTLNQLIINNKLQNIFDDIFSVEIVKIYKPSSKAYSIPIKNIKLIRKKFYF